jgi:hypothetical protein
MKPMMLLALALSTAHAAEPTGALTLACQGTATMDIGPEPVSVGIIINVADRTVTGFGVSGLDKVKVDYVDETSIGFSSPPPRRSWTIRGHRSYDRRS